MVEYITTDHEYVKTIGLPLVAGRDFLSNSEADTKESFIINETAVKEFGWGTPQQALGRKLSTSGKEGIVVGVLKDYHQHGLQSKIKSVVLSPVGYYSLYAIRYDGITPSQAVATRRPPGMKSLKGTRSNTASSMRTISVNTVKKISYKAFSALPPASLY